MNKSSENNVNLRKLIDNSLALDSDLDAFCIDNYPDTARRFSNGLNRIDKINILLTLNDSGAVCRRLQQWQSDLANNPQFGLFDLEKRDLIKSSIAVAQPRNTDGFVNEKSFRLNSYKTVIIFLLTLLFAGILISGYLISQKLTKNKSEISSKRNNVPPIEHQGSIPRNILLQKIRTPANTDLITISGSSSQNIWAVGIQNTVIRFNGKEWTKVNPDHNQKAWTGDWKGVWSNGVNDVWIVGSFGRIMHFDGSVWSDYKSRTTQVLWRLWGRSQNDIWAVGNSGTILHFDGDTWNIVQSGTRNNLLNIWGNEENVWIVGREGEILKCNLHGCITEVTQSGTWIRGIYGFQDENNTFLWAVGTDGVILNKSSGLWKEVYRDKDSDLVRVWGSSPNDIWVIGGRGTIIHWDGHTFESVESPVSAALTGIWGSAAGNVWLVGSDGTVLHYSAN